MAISAAVSSTELDAQAKTNYVGKLYQACLINAPGITYQPGVTVDATFMASEVTNGFAGYSRQSISYVLADVGAYADDGVGMATKATTFAHDGGTDILEFTHVALVEANGAAATLGAVGTVPTSGVDGTYTNIPTTGGTGTGLTVNLTVSNSGAAPGDWVLEIQNAGSGYTAADSITITELDLQAAGVFAGNNGPLGFSIATIYSSAGAVVAVAQTAATVQLIAGNEAIFYWNIKQYGFTS